MCSYYFVDKAELELDRELRYSSRKWGKPHSRKYSKEIEAKISLICQSPHMYPEDDGVRCCRIKGNIIYYYINENKEQIVVLSFLNCYQERPSNLLKRIRN